MLEPLGTGNSNKTKPFTLARHRRYENALKSENIPLDLKMKYLKNLQTYALSSSSCESFVVNNGPNLFIDALKHSGTTFKIKSGTVKAISLLLPSLPNRYNTRIISTIVFLTTNWQEPDEVVLLLKFINSFITTLTNSGFTASKLIPILTFLTEILMKDTSDDQVIRYSFYALRNILRFSKILVPFLGLCDFSGFFSKTDWLKIKTVKLMVDVLTKFYLKINSNLDYGSSTIGESSLWGNMFSVATVENIIDSFVSSTNIEFLRAVVAFIQSISDKPHLLGVVVYLTERFKQSDHFMSCLLYYFVRIWRCPLSIVTDEPSRIYCLAHLWDSSHREILSLSQLTKCLFILVAANPRHQFFRNLDFLDSIVSLFSRHFEFPLDLRQSIFLPGTQFTCPDRHLNCFCSLSAKFDHSKIDMAFNIFRMLSLIFSHGTVPHGVVSKYIDFFLCCSQREYFVGMFRAESIHPYSPVFYFYCQVLRSRGIEADYDSSPRLAEYSHNSLFELFILMRWKFRSHKCRQVCWSTRADNNCRYMCPTCDPVMLRFEGGSVFCSRCDLCNISSFFSMMFKSGMKEAKTMICDIDEEEEVVTVLAHLAAGCMSPRCFLKRLKMANSTGLYFELLTALDKYNFDYELVKAIGTTILDCCDPPRLYELCEMSIGFGLLMDVICSFIVTADVSAVFSLEWLIRQSSLAHQFYHIFYNFCFLYMT